MGACEMSEEDRIFWSTLEWWKVVYDFYKNFQTIAFASIAVSGALLGGPFGDTISSKNGLLLELLVLVSFAVAFASFLFTSWKAIQGMSMARR
jgi:esterase/lipase